MADPELSGHCTCGEIRYQLRSAPMIVHCCHCRWCQRESGGAFALNAMIEADRVELLCGALEIHTIATQSGKGQKLSRCSNCRIVLWSNYAGLGDLACFVRVGTLDNPELCPPDIHIFTASKLPWVVLPPEARAVPEFYDRKIVWPAASLSRRQALLDKAAGKP